MKCIVAVVLFAVCASARPDIGLQLAGGYLPPGGGGFGGNFGGNGGAHHGFSGSSGQSSYGNSGGFTGNGGFGGNGNGGFGSSTNVASNHYSSGNGGFGGFGGSNSGFGGSNSGFGGHSETSFGGTQHYSSSGSTGGFSGFGGGHGQGHGHGGGGSQTHKNVYYFDTPEADQAAQFRVRYESGGHSNQNIIFIKAPSVSTAQVPQIQLQNQHEDRTRVYVLVKKQDEPQEIVIPTAPPSASNKPEVYFIKYKTKADAHQQIQAIQESGSSSSGVSAQDVGSDSQLVSTIQETEHSHQGGAQTYTAGGSSDSSFIGGSLQDGHDHGNSNGNSFTSSSNSVYSGTVAANNHGPVGASGPYKK